MDIEPTTPIRLIHRLARRCRLELDVERRAGVVEWLTRIVLAVGFAVCGVGFFTVVFWFMSGVLVGAFVAAGVLPSSFVWSSGWWALTTACATTLTCLAVVSFIWQELRQEMRVPSPRLRLRLRRDWLPVAGHCEALALDTAMRLLAIADLERRDAALRHQPDGWTLTLPLPDGARVDVALAGWPAHPTIAFTSGGEAGAPVTRRFTLGHGDEVTPRLWRLVDGLVARLGAHAGCPSRPPHDHHPLELETLAAARPADWPVRGRDRIDVDRRHVIERAGLGEPPGLAARCGTLALAAAPPAALLALVGWCVSWLPTGLAFGAVPIVLLTATLLALPGVELYRAVCAPALAVEHTGRQHVVIEGGRLWLEHEIGRVVDLHAPFSVSLTRDPVTAGDPTTWLGVEIRQRRHAGRPVTIGLRVPARQTPALEALARYSLAAPEIDADTFAEHLWPALSASLQLDTAARPSHGLPMPS